MGKSVLVVDDDDSMRTFLATVLREEGHRVVEASRGEEGLGRLAAEPVDLVVTDLRMPGLSGLDLLRQGRAERPEARWIVLTAYGSIESAVEAMRAGAFPQRT